MEENKEFAQKEEVSYDVVLIYMKMQEVMEIQL